MKKVVFSLLAITAFGLTTNAQQVVKFGPKAGANLATFNNGSNDIEMKVSFHVGAFAEISLMDQFALQPELLYSAQGAKSGNNKWNYDFINIPIMAKYYVIDDLAVEAGPYVGFLMNAKIKGNDGVSMDVKDGLNTVDFGLGFGVSYNFNDGLFAGARYNFGLTDLAKNNEYEAVKNSVIQISVGYRF